MKDNRTSVKRSGQRHCPDADRCAADRVNLCVVYEHGIYWCIQSRSGQIKGHSAKRRQRAKQYRCSDLAKGRRSNRYSTVGTGLHL